MLRLVTQDSFRKGRWEIKCRVHHAEGSIGRIEAIESLAPESAMTRGISPRHPDQGRGINVFDNQREQVKIARGRLDSGHAQETTGTIAPKSEYSRKRVSRRPARPAPSSPRRAGPPHLHRRAMPRRVFAPPAAANSARRIDSATTAPPQRVHSTPPRSSPECPAPRPNPAATAGSETPASSRTPRPAICLPDAGCRRWPATAQAPPPIAPRSTYRPVATARPFSLPHGRTPAPVPRHFYPAVAPALESLTTPPQAVPE